jgi:acyl carrier protein
MSDLEPRLRRVFAESLGLAPDAVTDTTAFNKIPEWDSISHMQLIAGIDQEFGTMLETDDILALSSFAKAKDIVGRNLA